MKRVIIVSLFLISAAICVMLLGLRGRDEPAAVQRSVLLLTQEDTGSYFMQLHQGIQKALEERNCTLTMQIVDSASITAFSEGGIEYSGVLIYIKNEALRREVLKSISNRGMRAAIIDAHEEGFPSAEQDVQALLQSASEVAARAERVICSGGDESLRRVAKSVFRSRWSEAETIDPNAEFCSVIALDGETAARLVREKESGLWAHPLILVNSGENTAAWLESGQVQAAILPSPYATGYIAAGEALWNENKQRYRAPAFIVTPENMYDAQNVKLVFPLLY